MYFLTINFILTGNNNIRKFNVYMPIPDNDLLKYSEILSSVIKSNKQLKYINFINLEELRTDNRKAINLAHEFYDNQNSSRNYRYLNKVFRKNDR